MAAGGFLNRTKVFHDEFSSFNNLAFDNVDIGMERIFAQDTQDERGILIGKSVRWPFGIFGKVEKVERLVLVWCVGTGLRMQRGQSESRYNDRKQS